MLPQCFEMQVSLFLDLPLNIVCIRKGKKLLLLSCVNYHLLMVSSDRVLGTDSVKW